MMGVISYEDIDLFYYHSIDFDFARFFSILTNGIVSKKVAEESGLKYYYRNYTHSSARNEYISVSHFPRTIFRYYKIENELYDFNTNKICFIIDDVDVLEKQACNNRMRYTNERHVYDRIAPSKIKGILLRDIDAKKKLSEIPFNYKFTDKAYFENKVFITIAFFVDNYGMFTDIDTIYYLIGKLREAQICGFDDQVIIEEISRTMQNSISQVLRAVLGVEDPTLLDVIKYFNKGMYPIYVMNRYDIQLAGHDLATTDSRLEQAYEHENFSVSEMKQKEKSDKKRSGLLKKMTDVGLDIYHGYALGPLVKEDFLLVEEIRKLSLRK